MVQFQIQVNSHALFLLSSLLCCIILLLPTPNNAPYTFVLSISSLKHTYTQSCYSLKKQNKIGGQVFFYQLNCCQPNHFIQWFQSHDQFCCMYFNWTVPQFSPCPIIYVNDEHIVPSTVPEIIYSRASMKSILFGFHLHSSLSFLMLSFSILKHFILFSTQFSFFFYYFENTGTLRYTYTAGTVHF